MFAKGKFDITRIALEKFCEDLGTCLDLTAPSHQKALANFERNLKLLKAGKNLPQVCAREK